MIENESVLDCLLRHHIKHPNACRSGICQSCLIKSKPAMVEASWQEGLPDTLKKQGYFLACMAHPTIDTQLEKIDHTECDVVAKIASIEKLTFNVLQVKLLLENLNTWVPGQYVGLITPTGIMRSYSIANIPAEDGYIELHIKLCPNGAMSSWLQETASIDMYVTLRGPFGQCFYYNPERLNFDILLAGTGTGLAPLIAIVKSALAQGHVGHITLIHGGCTDDDIYYVKEMNKLLAEHGNLHYEPCVLKSNGRFPEAAIDQKITSLLTHPGTVRVYVCGPKETTKKLKTKAFLAGVPSAHILSDAFV